MRSVKHDVRGQFIRSPILSEIMGGTTTRIRAGVGWNTRNYMYIRVGNIGDSVIITSNKK